MTLVVVCPLLLFQSTPSRRGRHTCFTVWVSVRRVSIHSLTQRETAAGCPTTYGNFVSIHSLTQRETLPFSLAPAPTSGFNPLPHAEGDVVAPCKRFCPSQFQSTPSRRGRHFEAAGKIRSGGVSIHSLTQRETASIVPSCHFPSCFNPLPHAEGDVGDLHVSCTYDVSIHSLTQRETTRQVIWKRSWRSFNPLPHAEGDNCPRCNRHAHIRFNPLPHAEGDWRRF